MLSKNGKVLLLSDSSMEKDLDVIFVKECIALLKKKAGSQIILDFTENHISSAENGRIREQAKGFKFPLSETVLRNGVHEKWIYYTDIKDFGIKIKHYPKYHTFKEAPVGFNGAKADDELLFYMVFIAPYCEKIPQLAEKQNPNPFNKPSSWKVLLPEVEAADIVAMGKKSALIMNKIYNELPVEDIRTLARNFDIPSTSTMKEDQLRVALYRQATKDTDSMERFLRDFNVNPYVELVADVNTAVEKHLIAVDKRFGKRKWAYVVGGKLSDAIVKDLATAGSNPTKEKEILYDFYKTHPEDYKILQAKLSPEIKEIKSEATD